MWPVIIVVHFVCFRFYTEFIKRFKYTGIQEFPPDIPIASFYKGILRRLARLNEQKRNAMFLAPKVQLMMWFQIKFILRMRK